jgi:hypothetical protein
MAAFAIGWWRSSFSTSSTLTSEVKPRWISIGQAFQEQPLWATAEEANSRIRTANVSRTNFMSVFRPLQDGFVWLS